VKGWEPTRWIEKKKLKEMDRFMEFALAPRPWRFRREARAFRSGRDELRAGASSA
jgi:hypothetical protein